MSDVGKCVVSGCGRPARTVCGRMSTPPRCVEHVGSQWDDRQDIMAILGRLEEAVPDGK